MYERSQVEYLTSFYRSIHGLVRISVHRSLHLLVRCGQRWHVEDRAAQLEEEAQAGAATVALTHPESNTL